MKRVFVLAILLMSGFFARAQVDTIHIGQIWSSVPVMGKLADLPFVFGGKGEWCCNLYNYELKYYPWNIHDTAVYVYRVNEIYDKKTRTSYASDKDGNIRLRYLDFKSHRGVFMALGDVGLYLTSKTTIDDFIKAYNITDTILFGTALMAPWNYYKYGKPRICGHKQFTSLWFWTDEGRRTHITFSFDDKRHLRCVELDYFNAKVEVQPFR